MFGPRIGRRETGLSADTDREGDLAVLPETLPPPSVAAAVFGNRLDVAIRYAELLASQGVARGLVGPREAERIWDRHLLNCAAVAPLVPPGSRVCDVGSGAGLPGLVVAILRPDTHVTLLEPLLRRTRFLEECIADLDLGNASVVRGRAEDHAGAIGADVVLARAVAPLDRLLGWTLPLLDAGGRLLAMKGESAATELAAAEPILRALGARSWRAVRLDQVGSSQPTFVVEVLAPVGRSGRSGHRASRRTGG